MKIALVNTNRIKPPIAPIGLEYVAETLYSAGYSFEILDLCWEENYEAAIYNFFNKSDFDLTGGCIISHQVNMEKNSMI
jgi:hypothetical protein